MRHPSRRASAKVLRGREERMGVGLIVKWGKLVPGREEQAISLFTEVTEFFGEYLRKGVIGYFEPFFYLTSDRDEDTGFFILKGAQEAIFKLMEDEKYLL